VKFCWIPVRVAGEPGMLRALEALEDCARRLTAEGIDAAAHSADAGDERQLTAALDFSRAAIRRHRCAPAQPDAVY